MAGNDKYSAAEQGLGYFYQPRLALLQLLRSPEETSVFVEKDDDLDFVDAGGKKTLSSLKHKAAGERLTDLSTDFWKSVRIWLTRYEEDGRLSSTHRFYLFTTDEVSDASFLKSFLSSGHLAGEDLSSLANRALEKTKSEFIQHISTTLYSLNEAEQNDFWARVVIFDRSPRIEDIPKLIKDGTCEASSETSGISYLNALRDGG